MNVESCVIGIAVEAQVMSTSHVQEDSSGVLSYTQFETPPMSCWSRCQLNGNLVKACSSNALKRDFHQVRQEWQQIKISPAVSDSTVSQVQVSHLMNIRPTL